MEPVQEIASPVGYSLMRSILKSGVMAFVGWIPIFTVSVSSVVVSFRHLIKPSCHNHGTRYFEMTHVCVLWFLCQVGILGNMQAYLHFHYPFCGCGNCAAPETLISVGAGLFTVLICSLLVCLVLRQKPNLDSLALLSLFCAIIGVFFATGTMAYFRW